MVNYFYRFLGNSVVGFFGYTKMMALLKENKGTTVCNHLIVDDIVSFIFLAKNHEESWTHALSVKQMSREEQEKWENHKTLATPEKKAQYAPVTPRFNKKTKRKFGVSVVNEGGVEYYAAVKKNW